MTNGMTIRIVLTIMLAAGWVASVVDVKGAFLHGQFQDGEEIYMKIPQGWENIILQNLPLNCNDAFMGSKKSRWLSGTSYSNARNI